MCETRVKIERKRADRFGGDDDLAASLFASFYMLGREAQAQQLDVAKRTGREATCPNPASSELTGECTRGWYTLPSIEGGR